MDKFKNNTRQNDQTLNLSLEETVYHEIVKALYLALPASIFANIVIASAMASILWSEVDNDLLTIWLVVMLLLSFRRLVIYKIYVKNINNIKDIYFWDRLFYFFLILTGLTWSCISIWLIPANDSVYHYIPALILIGISAGAVTSLGFKMRNIVTYFIFLLIPLFISEVMIGTFISDVIAFLIITFIILALTNAKRINTAMTENISFRYEAESHERELIENKDAAIAANSAKTNFVSMISHELRTPLNAILGFGQLLKMSDEPALTEEQDDQTQGILDSGKHLLSLIEELLDLSEIEAHKIKLNINNISLADALTESIAILNPVATDFSIELINNIENKYVIKADTKRLKQIFINLISNAIKYNHENGKVNVSVKEIANNRVRISVADGGDGLSEEQAKNLFKPFQRYNNEQVGIGLGLYITKNLVELMDGTIGVESEAGKGSTFWFELALSDEV